MASFYEAARTAVGRIWAAQPAAQRSERGFDWFRRVGRAAWHVVGAAPLLFLCGSLLLLAADLIGLYNVQLLSTLTAALSGQTGAPGVGFFGAWLWVPKDPQTDGWVFLGLVVFGIVLRIVQRVVATHSENDSLARLKLELHDRLLTLPLAFHKENSAENLMQLVAISAQNANQMFRQLLAAPITQLIPLATAIVFIYGNLGIMRQQNGGVLAVLFLALISLPVLGWTFSKRVDRAFGAAGELAVKSTTELANSLSKPEEIQLMDAQAQRKHAYGARLLAQYRAQTLATIGMTFGRQVEDAIPAVVQASFLVYGAYTAFLDPATGGAIVGLYLFVPNAVNPLKTVVDLVAQVGGAHNALGGLLKVLEAKSGLRPDDTGVALAPDDRIVRLRDVTLSAGGAVVLDNLSLEFAAGKTTSIVGHSGAGKSTILNLVAGLMPPDRGTISIGDKNVGEIANHSLRRHVTKVSQDPLLISGSVRENFQLAKADATDVEIEEVCRQTGLWEILVKHRQSGGPLDFQIVQKSAIGLSGGERRLLAVSRALLLHPTVLLLDEPTTGLDANSRKRLCEVLTKVFKGTTVILIDHSMEFVEQMADEVCCLEHGKITSSGPPQVLLGRDSLFAELKQDELNPMRKGAAQTRMLEEWTKLIKGAESAGEFLVAFDLANKALDEFPNEVYLRYLAVRALARSGATQVAAKLYDRYHLSQELEHDIPALGARILKDEGWAAQGGARAALLRKSAEAYADVFRRKGNYYEGVNAATLFTLIGDDASAAPLVQAANKLCGEDHPTDPLDIYYLEATRAELALLGGDAAAASAALTRAIPPDFDNWAAMATTRRQLQQICSYRGMSPDVLKPLQAPPILSYLGHMISPPGTPGRFPADQEKSVAERIADYLAKHDIRIAYGSLACGADILFAEAILARQGELHVVMPFELVEFKRISVLRGGEGWGKRFDDCLGGAKSVTYATDDAYLNDNSLFAYATHFAMGLAVLRGKYLGAEVNQVAVWDGMARTGNAGTAADIDFWRGRGWHTDVIAVIRSPEFDAGAIAAVDAREDAMPHRQTHAMLFGDFHGYSALHERDIPVFQNIFMRAIAEVLEQFGDAVLYRNTWGDAIYVVLSDAVQGARCALAIQNRMAQLERGALPVKPELRLAGHFGPTFAGYDNVRGEKTFFGAHVTRAARLEPITPTNLVYVTQAFAAALTMEDTPDLSCEYVGQLPAAKNYGTMPMYLLRAKT